MRPSRMDEPCPKLCDVARLEARRLGVLVGSTARGGPGRDSYLAVLPHLPAWALTTAAWLGALERLSPPVRDGARTT